MSLSDILGSALSGLNASQAGLRTVSNNIANVGTPGYARETISISTGVTSGRVNGVTTGQATRVADRFLEQTVYQRAGDMGRADVTASYLDRLQSLLGAPGADSALPARLDSISASAIAMTAAPNSPETVATFASDVQDAISTMQQLSQDVDGLRSDVESEVGYTVDRVNTLLKQIYDLNESVVRYSGTGQSSAGVEDQRMSAVQELSSLVKVNVRQQPDGRYTIETGSGAVLLDRRLRQLSYPSGGGVSQPIYPAIEVRFADGGAATGEKIDSPAIGGKLGGLLDLRDRAMPAFTEKLGTLFSGLSQTLNAASNAGTAVPPPSRLDGRPSGLTEGDKLRFTGAATFAVTKSDGTLVKSTTVDFDALGPNATVKDAIDTIQAGLGTTATVSIGTDGTLSIAAKDAGNGIAIAQDANRPSDRAGVGFSQFFGLNDIVRSDASALTPTGFTADDPHGFDFASGETAEIVLRDSTGRALTQYTLTGSKGSDWGDLVDELKASPLAQFGQFSLDDAGRIRFQPDPSVPGAKLSIPSDSTDRSGTGLSFSALSGLTGDASGLMRAEVAPAMLADSSRVPLAQLQTGVAVGQKALGSADIRNATEFSDRLSQAVDFGKEGVATLDRFSSLLLGDAGTQASQAQSQLEAATARRDDAVNRRDSFSGVNIDEELSQMVVFQNSYSAAARVFSAANQMYDTLLGMVN